MDSSTNKKTELDSLMPMIRERLCEGHNVSFTPSGVSMLPTIRPDRDIVTLSPLPEGMLRKYDLPLYRRDNGQYVLHRIVGVNGDGTYTCVGDNHIALEHGVRHDQMIAVVALIERGKKKLSSDSWTYLMYCRFWHYTRFFRRIWRGVRRRVSKLLRVGSFR